MDSAHFRVTWDTNVELAAGVANAPGREAGMGGEAKQKQRAEVTDKTCRETLFIHLTTASKLARQAARDLRRGKAPDDVRETLVKAQAWCTTGAEFLADFARLQEWMMP